MIVVDDVVTPDECDVMNATLEQTAFADRLLVARDGAWLDEPIRERELDLLAILADYDRS
jgi:hypothetical protein